jgi:hypothetical protein
MAKVNYQKVEEQLAAGLRKMQVQRLLEQAKEAQEKGGNTPQAEEPQAKAEPVAVVADKQASKQKLQTAVKSNLERLLKKADDKPLVENPGEVNTEEWQSLKKMSKELKTEEKEPEAEKNEALLAQQKKRSVNKRFNVQEKWLPLDTHSPPPQRERPWRSKY